MRELINVSYVDYKGKEQKCRIPKELDVIIQDLNKDSYALKELYKSISLALYGDENVWEDLGEQTLRDEILRHFFDMNKIKEAINEQ